MTSLAPGADAINARANATADCRRTPVLSLRPVPSPGPSARRGGTPRTHGNTTVLFRFGVCPTGMRAISFISFVSTTDTSFDPAFATYR